MTDVNISLTEKIDVTPELKVGTYWLHDDEGDVYLIIEGYVEDRDIGLRYGAVNIKTGSYFRDFTNEPSKVFGKATCFKPIKQINIRVEA